MQGLRAGVLHWAQWMEELAGTEENGILFYVNLVTKAIFSMN